MPQTVLYDDILRYIYGTEAVEPISAERYRQDVRDRQVRAVQIPDLSRDYTYHNTDPLDDDPGDIVTDRVAAPETQIIRVVVRGIFTAISHYAVLLYMVYVGIYICPVFCHAELYELSRRQERRENIFDTATVTIVQYIFNR